MSQASTEHGQAPQNLHGVLLQVAGLGVLLTGPSGIGKGQLALALIDRGARLIADDAPEFILDESGRLLGLCPPLLRDFLEVRGLGLLDIRALYGDTAVADSAPLQLVVELLSELPADTERLGTERPQCQRLGQSLPLLQLPLHSPPQAALLIEVAARREVLYYNGYDMTTAFIQRQHQGMRKDSQQ